MIAAFGLHLVKTGKLQPKLGRALNRAQEIRQVADYTGENVDEELASWVVEQSRRFIEAMQTAFHIGEP